MANWIEKIPPEHLEHMMRAQREPVWPEFGSLMPKPYRRDPDKVYEGDGVPLFAERHPQSVSDIRWETSIEIVRRPWYKISPSELFWRSRAGNGPKMVLARELAERIDRTWMRTIVGTRND